MYTTLALLVRWKRKPALALGRKSPRFKAHNWHYSNTAFNTNKTSQATIYTSIEGGDMASPSAAMETDGDDSVIEVEMPPSTKEVIEIDLTDSPMPKVKKKTVIIGGERAPQSGTPKSKASASAAVATNTTPISATATAATNTSPQEVAQGCPVCFDSIHDIRNASQKNF